MIIVIARILNALMYHKLYRRVNKKRGGSEAAPKKTALARDKSGSLYLKSTIFFVSTRPAALSLQK